MLKIRLNTAGKKAEKAAEMAAYAVFYMGLFLSVTTVCKIKGVALFSAAAGLVLQLGCIAAEGMEKQKRIQKALHIILSVFSGLLPVILLLGITGIFQGALSLCNAFLDNLGVFLGEFINTYEITSTKEMIPVLEIVFLLILGCFLAGICEMVRIGKNRILVLVLGMAAIIFPICWFPETIKVSVMMMAAGVLLLWMRLGSTDEETGKPAGSGKSFAGLQNMAIAAILFLTAVFSSGILGQDGMFGRTIVKTTRQAVEKQMDRIRFGKKNTDSMPKGQFSNLGDLELKEEPALEIIMEKPSSFYLKGFVGSVYTREGWQEVDKAAVYEEKDLFYWLHEGGFSGLTQLSSLYALEQPKDVETGKIVVKNVGADREYCYVPYELASLPEEIDGAESFGDVSMKAEGFLPGETMQYHAHTNLVSQYPQIASDFYFSKDSDVLKEYVKNEGSYNAFVYQNFLEVPQDLQMLFEKLFEMPKVMGESHLPYEKANTQITGYLNENVRYSEEVQKVAEGSDFVQQFLEVSRKGYSVHYATAATMMYRYFGIPARYVEGYLLTPEAVEDAEPYGQITVTGKEAHAWVEIYQDGVGWIPMEVTPTYMDKMERPEFEIAAYASAEESTGVLGEDAPEEIQDHEEQKPESKKGNDKIPVKTILKILLLGILLLLIAALAVYEIRGRKQLLKKKRALAAKDVRAAVCGTYEWMMYWLYYDGLSNTSGSRYDKKEEITEKYGEKLAVQYVQVTAVAEEAAYSSHEIDRVQVQSVRALMEEVQKQILQKAGILKKIRMRFVDFLY